MVILTSETDARSYDILVVELNGLGYAGSRQLYAGIPGSVLLLTLVISIPVVRRNSPLVKSGSSSLSREVIATMSPNSGANQM